MVHCTKTGSAPAQDRRVDRTRVHDVDPDAARRELERGDLRQPAQPPLRDRVGEREVRACSPAIEPMLTIDAPVVVRHQRNHRLHAEHRPGQVDPDHPVPARHVHVQQPRPVGHARVVDQAVDHAAVRGQPRRERPPTAPRWRRPGASTPSRPGPSAVSRSASALPSSSRMSAPIDPRTLADEDLRLRGALAARRAGDDDRPSRQSVIHQASPFRDSRHSVHLSIPVPPRSSPAGSSL